MRNQLVCSITSITATCQPPRQGPDEGGVTGGTTTVLSNQRLCPPPAGSHDVCGHAAIVTEYMTAHTVAHFVLSGCAEVCLALEQTDPAAGTRRTVHKHLFKKKKHTFTYFTVKQKNGFKVLANNLKLHRHHMVSGIGVQVIYNHNCQQTSPYIQPGRQI